MLPYDTRPHRWHPVTGRCAVCAMHSSWEGARYACTGVIERPKQEGGGRPKGVRGTCSTCGAVGHYSRSCPTKGPRLTQADYARRYRERRAKRLAMEPEARR